jgi:hypothetical protein
MPKEKCLICGAEATRWTAGAWFCERHRQLEHIARAVLDNISDHAENLLDDDGVDPDAVLQCAKDILNAITEAIHFIQVEKAPGEFDTIGYFCTDAASVTSIIQIAQGLLLVRGTPNLVAKIQTGEQPANLIAVPWPFRGPTCPEDYDRDHR